MALCGVGVFFLFFFKNLKLTVWTSADKVVRFIPKHKPCTFQNQRTTLCFLFSATQRWTLQFSHFCIYFKSLTALTSLLEKKWRQKKSSDAISNEHNLQNSITDWLSTLSHIGPFYVMSVFTLFNLSGMFWCWWVFFPSFSFYCSKCLSIEPISMTVSPELDVSVFNLEYFMAYLIRNFK